ncbi:flagellar FlbD family protein [bacterium]|nr:flagellar FlbD family protein [bacterium]
MILVTKLDGNSVLMNTDNIKYIEATADTIIHYINGDTLIIKENLDSVRERLLDYQKKVLSK